MNIYTNLQDFDYSRQPKEAINNFVKERLKVGDLADTKKWFKIVLQDVNKTYESLKNQNKEIKYLKKSIDDHTKRLEKVNAKIAKLKGKNDPGQYKKLEYEKKISTGIAQ